MPWWDMRNSYHYWPSPSSHLRRGGRNSNFRESRMGAVVLERWSLTFLEGKWRGGVEKSCGMTSKEREKIFGSLTWTNIFQMWFKNFKLSKIPKKFNFFNFLRVVNRIVITEEWKKIPFFLEGFLWILYMLKTVLSRSKDL